MNVIYRKIKLTSRIAGRIRKVRFIIEIHPDLITAYLKPFRKLFSFGGRHMSGYKSSSEAYPYKSQENEK